VTVVDGWQRRGLGTLLLEKLSERARVEGIERYTALVSGENRAVVGLLDAIGARVLSANAAAGTVEYEVELAPVGLGHSLREALRAAASGQMTLTRRAAEALGSLLEHVAPSADGEGSEEDAPSPSLAAGLDGGLARGNLLAAAEQRTMHERAEQAAGQRRDDEQPQLAERPAADEDLQCARHSHLCARRRRRAGRRPRRSRRGSAQPGSARPRRARPCR
jgi:acetyltransferase (GNAT) family protein